MASGELVDDEEEEMEEEEEEEEDNDKPELKAQSKEQIAEFKEQVSCWYWQVDVSEGHLFLICWFACAKQARSQPTGFAQYGCYYAAGFLLYYGEGTAVALNWHLASGTSCHAWSCGMLIKHIMRSGCYLIRLRAR